MSGGIGCRAAVHPRVRGEQLIKPGSNNMNSGSSPRARGAEWYMQQSQTGLRFIPTYAGSSQISGGWRNLCPVHPHVRGEQSTL